MFYLDLFVSKIDFVFSFHHSLTCYPKTNILSLSCYSPVILILTRREELFGDIVHEIHIETETETNVDIEETMTH